MAVKFVSDFSNKVWTKAYNEAKQGSIEAFDKLIEIAEPSIKNIARAHTYKPNEFEEFCQLGRIFIVKTVNLKKEPIKKVKNYFLKSIKGEIKQGQQRIQMHAKRFIPFDSCNLTPNPNKPNKHINILETLKAKDTSLSPEALYLQKVLKKLAQLPKSTQEIMLMPLDKSIKTEELAKKLNISVDNLFQIRSRIRRYLKKTCPFKPDEL